MKKIIITILTVIVLLVILFYPYEKLSTADGGSTTYYITLIASMTSYERPPIGSKTYKKGKIISILGKEIFNDVVELGNPQYGEYLKRVGRNYNEILNLIGEHKTNSDIMKLITLIRQLLHNAEANVDEIKVVDANGDEVNINNLSNQFYYNVEVVETYDYGVIKTIRVTPYEINE